MRFATDTGGTFTDLIIEDDAGRIQMFKAATVPGEPVRGVLDVFEIAAKRFQVDRRTLLGRGDMFVHGTTHAINAIVTKKTAKTALLVTSGHPDIFVLREGGRREPFNHAVPYPDPYIPRALTFEVPERVLASGKIKRPLDEAAVEAVADQLRQRGVEAVAVCLLWSVLHPAHERRIGEILAARLPGVPVTLSHELNPALREYRRAISAALDASLKPLMNRYLAGLTQSMREAGFGGRILVLTSQGGMVDIEEVQRAPILAINSGPSMGPIAGARLAAAEKPNKDAIIFDTGGTTFDVSLVRQGRVPFTHETWLGRPLQSDLTGFPSVDVRSIGAGGGSIAWVEEGRVLRVGPQSAGAVPGPACYAAGGQYATVTDAALVLGYIDPSFFLGGRIRLDRNAAMAAVQRDVAGPFAMTLEAAASAIMSVWSENMVQAISDITVNQGIDPAQAVIIGGGGAAGLNALTIAERLGCEQLIIPEIGAALSAFGAAVSDIAREYRRVFVTSTAQFDRDGAAAIVIDLRRQALAFADAAGATAHGVRVDFLVEARYLHQVWEIDVAIEPDRLFGVGGVEVLSQAFHRAHDHIFAFSDPHSPIEVIAWRAAVRCPVGVHPDQKLTHAETPAEMPQWRRAFFPQSGWLEVPVLAFGDIDPNRKIDGPAIVESPFTSIVIDTGAAFTRSLNGNLVVTPGGPRVASEHTQAAVRGQAMTETLLDGAEMAILINRFEGIVSKMSNTLYRTGRSGVLNRARDFSCCIVTADCDLLAAADSLPIHTLVGPNLMARAVKEFHPVLKPGDAFLHNSPYHGNSHAADHTILIPVIDDDGIHRFTVLTKAHQADCGNALPTTYMGTAIDVYAEGALIFPAVKVQQDYRDIEDILRMCELRIRVPGQWKGDFLAMVGSARIGEREVLALGREAGWDKLQAFAGQWFDFSEQRMATRIRQMPAGKATGVSVHDPIPGTPSEGVRVVAAVEVHPQDGRITIDLRENIDALPCGLNLTEACAGTAALIGVFNSIGGDIPRNAGSFRRVEIKLRENSVTGIPRHPTSCSVATTNVADRLTHAVSLAISQLGNGYGIAECGGCLPPSSSVISGVDPRSGERFVNQLFLGSTAGPGTPFGDCWLTYLHVGNGGMCFIDSVELDELYQPIWVAERRIMPDTEGAGRGRGAPSLFVEFGPIGCSVDLAYVSDGSVNPALGVCGGGVGGAAGHLKRRVDGVVVPLSNCAQVTLTDGETIQSICCGGGGYGPPHERAPARVLGDVAEGWITKERARDVYAVVIDDTMRVDEGATQKLRASSSAATGAI